MHEAHSDFGGRPRFEFLGYELEIVILTASLSGRNGSSGYGRPKQSSPGRLSHEGFHRLCLDLECGLNGGSDAAKRRTAFEKGSMVYAEIDNLDETAATGDMYLNAVSPVKHSQVRAIPDLVSHRHGKAYRLS
jgi:hypothetical protein